MNIFLSGAIAALVGALIPVLIQPYIQHRQKIYARRVKHYQGLAQLEINLFDVDNALDEAIEMIKAIMKAVEDDKMTIKRFFPISISDSVFEAIIDNTLVNKIYFVRHKLLRLNRELLGFNHAYFSLNEAVVAKAIETEYYQRQVKALTNSMDNVIDNMWNIQKRVIQLIGYVKARQNKDMTWMMRHRATMLQNGLGYVSDLEVKLEVDKYLESTDRKSIRRP